MMEPQAQTLPKGWIRTTLEQIGSIASGGTPKTSDETNFDGNIPWITPADLTGYKAKYIGNGRRNITDKGLASSSARLLPKDTVLFSSRAPIGYVAIASNSLCTNQGFKNLIPSAGIDSEYVYYYLLGSKKLAESLASGTTFAELSARKFAKLPIPLAPLNEQKRIVDKIETLFSDLDKGEENLRAAQRLIASYRQSVLKAAVTGELTRDWREANKHRLEPGDKLLRRILQTRREQWKGRGKYNEPAAPHTINLPKLPHGWIWCRVEQIANVTGGLTKNAKRKELALKRPMLRVANVYQNRLELSDIHEIGVMESELNRVSLENGDLLIVEGNGSKDQIGRMAIWENQIPGCIHQNHLIKARLLENQLTRYVMTWFMSYMGREIIERVASSTSGLHTLSLSKVNELIVPLPPLEEAQEVVSRVEEVFSRISALETWCATELARSATLRQAILKSAFSGQLVPQDVSDEPASELLKRIQAERASTPKAKPVTKRRRPGKRRAA